MTYEDAINIYTDGSSYNSPRKGGMGLRIIIIDENGNEEINDVPLQGYKGATNNQMELSACIEGIKEVQQDERYSQYKKICVFSDSQYVVKNYQSALFQWSTNKWRNANGRPIQNAELWKELIKLEKKYKGRIVFHWIKGHAKDQHNKAVDRSAKKSAKGYLQPSRTNVKMRRKLSEKKTEIGCVVMKGQRIKIRVITDNYMKEQKCYQYRYEVIAKSNEYYGNIDIIFSNLLLNAGHSYFVKMNTEQANPTIMRIYKEI